MWWSPRPAIPPTQCDLLLRPGFPCWAALCSGAGLGWAALGSTGLDWLGVGFRALSVDGWVGEAGVSLL